jgi:tellurite resistance protein
MPSDEEVEVLKALLSVAAADGRIARSERGVFNNLARRIGVDETTLQQMIDKARYDPQAGDHLFKTQVGDPEQAMKLLVATARLDGEISQEERELLVDISTKLDIGPGDFSRVYQAGIAAADTTRKRAGR